MRRFIIVIAILLLCSFEKSLSSSWKEYCEHDQCDDDSYLTNEEAVKQYVERYGMDRLDNFIKARLDKYRNTPLKIAITGASGSGKSMLINTLRGLKPDDIGAAELGSVETTKEIERYSHPKYRNLKFYDLPGVGTPSYTKEKYLERISYEKYDFFFVISSKRFTENDLWLSQELKRKGKSFFFVRSKVDEDLMNEKRDHPKTFNEKKVLEKIRQDTFENIKTIDPNANIFVISGLLENTNKFDYTDMEKTLVDAFPNYKRQALIYSMTISSKAGIEAKVKLLKSQAWMIGILSGGVAAVQIPGLSVVIDPILISNTIGDYMNQLGLDDVSLKRWAHSHNLSLNQVYQKLQGESLITVFKNGVKNYVMEVIAKDLSTKVTNEFMKYIPVIGLTTSVLRSTLTTVCVLHKSLDEMLLAAHSIADLIK